MIIRDCALGQTRIVADAGPRGLRLGDVRIGNRVKGRFVGGTMRSGGMVGARLAPGPQDESIDRSPEDPFDRLLGDEIQASIKFRKRADAFVRARRALTTAPRLVRPASAPAVLVSALLASADVQPRKDIEPERAKAQPTGYDTRSKLSANYTAKPAASGAFWAGGYGKK